MRFFSALLVTIALLCCGGNVDAWAQPAPLDINDQRPPTFRNFGSQDGLSEEIWSTVGFDRHGFVWAGSASGLAKFDGYRWSMQSFPETHSLVRDMVTDADGNLWALFESEGLARYDGAHWELRSDVGGKVQRFSEILLPDGSRQLWLGHERGLSLLLDGHWRPDPGNQSMPLGWAISIQQTQTLYGEVRQWVAGDSLGLYFRRQQVGGGWQDWQRFDAPEVNAMPMSDLLVTDERGEEELWIVSYGAGVARIRGDQIRLWRAGTGELPTEAIYSARSTHSTAGERLLWLSTRAGLLRIRGDDVAVYDRRHGLPSDAIRGLKTLRSADGIDILWLATEGGMARAALTESQWQTVSLAGARANGIFGMLLEPDGAGGERLWVGTSKEGLALLHQGHWQYFRAADGTLPSEGTRALWRLPRPQQTDWRLVALDNGNLLQINDDLSFTPVAVPWSQAQDEGVVAALSRLHDGATEYWFGTMQSGIYRLREGHWQNYRLAKQLQPWAVYKLLEQTDATGRTWLWAASNRGLARLDGERWTLLGEPLTMPADSYRGLALITRSGRDVLWAGSNRNAVVRIDVTDPTNPVFDTETGIPPPPDPTVYSVLSDSQQRIYICTNNGVQQLTPNTAGGYDEKVYRRTDGLVHDECNGNSQFVDELDRYWVGTLGGLSLYDPAIEVKALSTKPKKLAFTELRVDGSYKELGEAQVHHLGAGTRELRFSYSVLSGLRERESTYRSRLTGFDPDYSAWTTERARSFTGLPPGDYEFVIEGRDYAGTPSPAQTLQFRIDPTWLQRAQTPWLLGLLVLAVLALSVLAYNRSLRLRQRRLKRLVTERTEDLRSANQRLTELSYADPLTGLANRRRLMEAIDIALDRARAQALPLGLIVLDVDHFKAYNDKHGHLAGDAALRGVGQALQTATRAQDLVARFGGEEFTCLMIDADQQTVARIAERMRALVEALPPRALGNETQTITISAGTLSRIPLSADTAASMLSVADAALYQAKNAGRNRVCDALAPVAPPATPKPIDE